MNFAKFLRTPFLKNTSRQLLLDSLKTLKNCGFNVRAMVSDNCSTKVLAYKLLLKESGHLDDNLFTEHSYQKIYLLHNAVHLIKNIRNNLLNHNISSFKNNGFEDPISVKCGQVSRK